MAKFYVRLLVLTVILVMSCLLLVLYAPRVDNDEGATNTANIGDPDVKKTSSCDVASRHEITLATDDEKTTQIFSWHETKTAKSLCAMVNYTNMPLAQMSVIICFHGKENVSNLLHTIHGVYQRTPPRLLKEIILIDDFSRNDDFGVFLELYVGAMFDNKVRILRNTERLGLIRSRLKGIRAASGKVVAVMDSHVEVQPGWAEPLLREIYRNPKTLAASYIDWMERKGDKWQYRHSGTTWKTYFDWTFIFGWQTMAESEIMARKSLIEPIRAPVIIGTIFAIRKDYFFEVGAFDEGMQLWGGENIDLPVRVWLCGGRVVNVPCSRAGHMENLGNRDYRLSSEWDLNKHRNYKRFAEVWAGDFKKYFYMYTPQAQAVNAGNITERIKLHSICTKNFSWYLQEVFPELGIPDRDGLAWGKLINQGSGQCLDTRQSSIPGQADCGHSVSTQLIYWSKWFHLRFPIHMLNYHDQPIPGMTRPGLYMAEYISLHNTDYGSQYFHVKDGPIIEMKMNKCLDASIPNQLHFTTCKNNSIFQNWRFEYYTNLYSDLIRRNSADSVIRKTADQYVKFYQRIVPGLRAATAQMRTLRTPR